MATKRRKIRKDSCKNGKLKRPIKTKSGRRRKCKKIKRKRKSRVKKIKFRIESSRIYQYKNNRLTPKYLREQRRNRLTRGLRKKRTTQLKLRRKLGEFDKGDRVIYTNTLGKQYATIIKKHKINIIEPYYTIKIDGSDSERQTDIAHLKSF